MGTGHERLGTALRRILLTSWRHEIDEINRARIEFFSATVLTLVPLGLVVAGFTSFSRPVSQDLRVWDFLVLSCFAILMMIAYVLNRVGRHKLAVTSSLMLAPFVIIVMAYPTRDMADLYYLVTPIILSSLLQPLGITIAVVGTSIGGILLFPILAANTGFTEVLVGPLSFVAICALLVILGVRQRVRLESLRQDQLEHSSSLIASLSRAVSRLEATSDRAVIMATLGRELRGLGLDSLIATAADEETQRLKVEYLSLSPEAVSEAEATTGIRITDLRIAKDAPVSGEVLATKSPQFHPKTADVAGLLAPELIGRAFEAALSVVGILPDSALACLPLSIQDGTSGVMAVWGSSLAEGDLSALVVFAGQVAMALRNAELYENEKHRAEELEESLEEKALLLQEIHHRVKNNLQIISSLLNLQERRQADEGLGRLIRSSQDRIRSMALVHEKLYGSRGLNEIDANEYVRSLVAQLARAYQSEAGNIRTTIEADELQLHLNIAIPFGLILSELVSNAFKHAFPEGRGGSLSVAVRDLGQRHVLLEVSDDGIGTGASSPQEREDTLGLHLVRTLVDQIGGVVESKDEGGTTVRLHFTNPES